MLDFVLQAGGRPKKAEKAVQKKAEKAVQLPEQLEAIKAPQQGSVVQPLGTIDTTPKPSSRAAALSLLFSKGLEEKRASAAVVRPLSSLSAFTPYGAGSRKGLSSPRSITEKANQPPHPDASGPQNLAQVKHCPFNCQCNASQASGSYVCALSQRLRLSAHANILHAWGIVLLHML